VPFSTLLFEANGNVCMCRRKGVEFAVGDIRKNTFEEIWNGETMQSIRREFISGKVRTCSTEIARDRCNLDADNSDLLEHIEISAVQSRAPIKITPNFNGRCNLECKMCHIWQMPNGIYDKIGFWETLEKEILPHLHEIDTFSGEPFIQKDTFRLISLAARVNPRIIWRFTTNGHWILNDYIRDHLDQLTIHTFNISLDSLDPRIYKEIRRKGDLQKVLENFEKLQLYEADRVSRGKTDLGIVQHVVIQRDNWQEIPEMLDFRRKKKIKIHLNFLLEPFDLSLSAFTKKEKLGVLRYVLDTVQPAELKMVTKIVRPLLPEIDPIDRAKFIVEFKERAL
jgi:radical SAM protein with 4Fe4S-binding SPASM domain